MTVDSPQHDFSSRPSDDALDRKMRQVIGEVPVPEGLRQRLLDRVSASVPPVRPAEIESELNERTSRAWVNRRSMWLTLFAVGAAACVLIPLLLNTSYELDATDVAQQVPGWINQIPGKNWQRTSPPIAQYPLDPSLRPFQMRWQRFETLDDSHGVVYSGLTTTQAPLFLFVARTQLGPNLPTLPPASPTPATGNYHVGLWKSDGKVYVLAVRGGANAYRAALKPDSLALALAPSPRLQGPQPLPRPVVQRHPTAMQNIVTQ